MLKTNPAQKILHAADAGVFYWKRPWVSAFHPCLVKYSRAASGNQARILKFVEFVDPIKNHDGPGPTKRLHPTSGNALPPLFRGEEGATATGQPR